MKFIPCFFLISLGIIQRSSAQKILSKINWQNLDYVEDSVYGISMEKAYRELLTDKKPDTVIVAVIDTGIDSLHEDLRSVLWRNRMEDGFDRDNNKYKGDIFGWNFLGGKNKQNLYTAPLEFERQYFRLSDKYGNINPKDIKKKQREEYELWLQVKEKFQGDSLKSVSGFWNSFRKLSEADSVLRKVLGKEEYVYADLTGLDESAIGKNNFMMELLQFQPKTTNVQYLAQYRKGSENILIPFSYSSYAALAKKRQEIVADNYYDFNDRFYGNSDISGKESHAYHGTHVAGILGAERNNGKGIDGIANAIKIMAIRAVPSRGDEYDKDIALAIRYAVDNGAKVINMSFAKPYSPERKWVAAAIRYAAKKDVLLVNGAGNDGKNIDTALMYPTASYIKRNKKAPNMITVGASGPDDEHLIPSFSNYGNKMVDVFAPGANIHSTITGDGGNQYAAQSGTSMASPVVSGLAAVLRSYYPRLSAKQVKHIIESSVIKITKPVRMPGRVNKNVSMPELCASGGIVNAYQAIKLAESIFD